MDQSSKFDLALFNRYDKAGARYTSYPTTLELHDGFSDEHYCQKIAKSHSVGGALFVYFHILFCDTVCFYYVCNKIITKTASMQNIIRTIYIKKVLCMVFDKYLAQKNQQQFSKVI